MSWLISRAMMEAYANSRSSLGLVGEYSADTCLGGEPSAPSNGSPTPQAFLPPDRMTAFSCLSRFGMTCAPLTDDLGEAVLMWCQEVSRAKRTAAHLEGGLWRMISGRRCDGSWQMSLPGTYLPKTSTDAQLTGRQTILRRWVIPSDVWRFPRQTWVRTTYGDAVGYLHTPTTIANFCAPSMQKHPSCRAWRKVFGAVSPNAFEYLMGWPLGWTDLRPLATAKSPSALQQLGGC